LSAGRGVVGWRRRPTLVVVALGATIAVFALMLSPFGADHAPSAIAQGPAGEPEVSARTDDSVPASSVTMIGASPKEAPDETFGVGELNQQMTVVRYTSEGGGQWSLGPKLLGVGGQPLQGFALARQGSTLAGQMAPDGSGALVGTVSTGEGATQETLLVRKPGGDFQQAAPVPAGEEVLKPGEQLFSEKHAPLLAPLEEEGKGAGALIVPVKEGKPQRAVLHWDGSHWTREPIESSGTVKGEEGEVYVLGIGASSPSNAWLLAQPVSRPEEVTLYHRHEGAWTPVAPASGKAPGAALEVPTEVAKAPHEEPFFIAGNPEKVEVQLLTVTSEGVWIDGVGEEKGTKVSTTLFFKPQGPEAGEVTGSWCPPVEGAPQCKFQLPESLPSGASRSFAWPNSSTPYGERVITGLTEGVSLRLEGTAFKRVLALGASAAPNDVGGTLGAAFSNPREGWLGNEQLPVHLTLDSASTGNRLSIWPVSFRHALLAIAPQPGVPVGALSSEALAVGDEGEVARYEPGKGWIPEGLLGPGGRRATPRLRAVAWPTPTRAFAVGDVGSDSLDQMWLWRGETGLWEPDPATPVNFRGSLLGIAFDPANPARGYAVGPHGILLGYGKTWTQEALPSQVQGASFTSVAFAGSEALVAYHKDEAGHRSGGLLVNSGSGWSVDEGAAAAMGSAGGSNIPATVAGLPDGGAAVATFGEAAKVFEREDGSWRATETPLPDVPVPPASLALFREGGALRVIAAGVAPVGTEIVAPPPPGFPPTIEEPAPLPSSEQQRGVVRQTSTGWSDEEHELNPVSGPPQNYKSYDSVYQPDSVDAVLAEATGSQGWAVGGVVEPEHHEGRLDTADVERYDRNPAEATTPPGIGTSPVPATGATFAIGGGAQCAAPCADRANAKIGPDVWLSAALDRAHQIGVQAFLYTGPRLSTGETEGAEPRFPFGREFERYASILQGSPVPVYAAPSSTDLDARPSGGAEATFAQSFAAAGLRQAGLVPSAKGGSCPNPTGCEYYSFSEGSGGGGQVLVIVLDDTGGYEEPQLKWLEEQLKEAASKKEPAIVIGNADLNAQIAAQDKGAAEVQRVLLQKGAMASAYFYDAPEQNVSRLLSLGGESIPTFGSGTLGYVNLENEKSGEFHGASGFLLAHVASGVDADNRAHVVAELIPNIGELALEAKDGTLLHRSQAYLFAGLARRPRAGNRSQNGGAFRAETDPYIPIPSNCVGSGCPPEGGDLLPTYTFSSSNEGQIGEFVAPNLATSDPHAVLLGANGKPIHDSESGLFCAYNPGTTVVTISAGGLSSSLPVTVQAGSVRRPCGTVPLQGLPTQQQPAPLPPPAPAPAPAPTPAGPAPTPLSVPLAVPAPPPAPTPPAPPPPARVAPPAPFFLVPAASSPVLAALPPPVPTPARPTPPSGTSAVTTPVEAPEKEEEKEEATESVGNQALAYRAGEHEPSPAYILGIVVLAAFAGATVRRRPGRGRRELRVAPATISAMRAQRRTGAGGRGWR
jgi:hypothetical protein